MSRYFQTQKVKFTADDGLGDFDGGGGSWTGVGGYVENFFVDIFLTAILQGLGWSR